MSKLNVTTAFAAALALALSGAAFGQETEPPVEETTPPATESGAMGEEANFDSLDTNADGYVLQAEIPAGHELASQFSTADSDKDARLSRTEFDAFMGHDETEEAE